MHVQRQTGGEAVRVHLYSVPPFRFEENLMSELVFEANDFVFNRGTVTWSAPLDNPRVQRRAVQASDNHRMRLRIGIGQIAGNLCLGDTFGGERERRGWLVSILGADIARIDRP